MSVRSGLVAVSGLLAALVLTAALVAGCASDGRELQAPPPGVTAPKPPTSTTTTPKGGAVIAQPVSSFAISSPAIGAGDAIPVQYTCDGAGSSPPLQWSGVPDGTAELALTVTDPEAGGFVHWVVARLDPTMTGLAQDGVPASAVQATNAAGTHGWTGPCPPKGSPHHYIFSLYALSQPSGVTDGMDGKAAIDAIAKIPATVATLSGTYQRAP